MVVLICQVVCVAAMWWEDSSTAAVLHCVWYGCLGRCSLLLLWTTHFLAGLIYTWSPDNQLLTNAFHFMGSAMDMM